jgi:Domain of unknown function (DUF4431)
MRAPAALFLSLLANISVADETRCLHYGDANVSLTGEVKLRTYFGPPNYGETPKQDAVETQAFLELRSPICVYAGNDTMDVAERDQRVVTLVPMKGQSFDLLIGKTIEVAGTLFHAHTGHHHTPVLISVVRISVIGDR